MRVLTPLLLVALAGCVTPGATTTTIPTQRMLMSPTPMAPITFAGGSGLALGLSLLPVAPPITTATGAVAHPTVQPELSGVLQLGGQTSVSARAAYANPTLGVQSQRTGVSLSPNVGAFDGTLGVGHDFSAASRRWGAVLSAELGLAVNTLVVSTAISSDSVTTLLTPTIRGAAGMWGTVGPEAIGGGGARQIRLYGGLSLGSTMSNDGAGTRTTTCAAGCSVTETGATAWGAVMMAGGGARWQVSPMFSVGVEGWAVLHSNGAQVPFVGTVMVRLGNFETTPARPREVVPPPAPAWEEPPPPAVPPPPV